MFNFLPMKTILFCLTAILFASSTAFSQLVFRHHYFQTDLSDYKTYRLGAFTVNDEEVNPEESSQVSAVQSKLHEALSKHGFEQAAEPDMLVFLNLKVDTLGAAIPSTEERELMLSFSVDIRQNPKFEKIFTGAVNGLNVTDSKTDARLKKIYRRFFVSFKR